MKDVVFYTQAYNSEKYIRKCIESILAQTYKEFDYFLIDNGSTDTTWSIISEYSKKDARIIPIHLESNIRNLLEKYIRIAYNEGYKYIAILDSDDWYEPDFAETMIEFAENEKLDIAVCGSKFHFVESNGIGYRKSNVDLIIEKKDYAKYFSSMYQFFRPVWAKIFKMSLFSDVKFDDIAKIAKLGGYGGDTVFSFIALEASKKIGISNRILHNYTAHNNSVSHLYNNKRFYCDVFLFNKSKIFLENLGNISNENYEFLYMIYISAIVDTINALLNSNLELVSKLTEIEDILEHPLTKQALKFNGKYKTAEQFKTNILNFMIELGQAEIKNSNVTNLIYKIMCILFDDVKCYINENEIEKHIKHPGYMLYMLGVDRKKLLSNNIFLEWIKNDNFIFEYSEIIRDVHFGDFLAGLEKALVLLIEDRDIKFKEELIFMSLNLSAALEDGVSFIYAKKLQAQLYINEGRFNEAKTVINDLVEMCPDDEDVVMLRKCLEEENV